MLVVSPGLPGIKIKRASLKNQRKSSSAARLVAAKAVSKDHVIGAGKNHKLPTSLQQDRYGGQTDGGKVITIDFSSYIFLMRVEELQNTFLSP